MQAQSQFDDYKYIVVPKRFDGFKKENQHQTSTLVKYLLTKRGFVTIYDDDMPTDLNSDRCLGLYANLIDDSSMFTTKAVLILIDCSGKEVFITQQGKSKQKEYKAAYSEVLREAFGSFDAINYSYKPKKVSNKEEVPITVSFKNDIKKLDEKPKLDKYQDPMIKQEATLENQTFKDVTPLASDIKKAADTEKEKVAQKITKSTNSQPSTKWLLYAQEIPNGYQLVDGTPKIRLKLYKGSLPNVYMAKGEGKDGLVYSKNEQWFFEYYEDGELVIEELKIKF